MSMRVVIPQNPPEPNKSYSQKVPPLLLNTLLPIQIVSFTASLTSSIHARLQPDPPSFPSPCDPISAFFSVSMPPISTYEYIERLVKYTACSNSAFVVMLIYIDRLKTSNSIQFVPHSMHRILLAALTVAVKNTDDIVCSSSHYAKVGGVGSVSEMNRLEMLFFKSIDYECFVSPAMYATYHAQLQTVSPTLAFQNSKAVDCFPYSARVCRHDQNKRLQFESCRVSGHP
eukprot:gb/GEZJ01000796.1/.p1 GENE.gb/GEZJ01000796.1/~~gb/GEZJ01000796.1/.p1  ORF type:complete len:229 (-),score=32.49 gb/GEZJ01000796.1/:1024-1710(-)